jgi:pyridoxal 5'-phosphate synthase pdxS subunit
MMQLGAETVFVGSGIFMKEGNIRLEVGLDPDGHPLSPHDRAEAESRAKAIVRAATHFNDPVIVAEASEDCLGAMKGLAVGNIAEADMMQNRGW